MGYCARVFLQRGGTAIAADIGEKELEVRPIRDGRAQFEHEGSVEVGHIGRIDPSDWDEKGIVPNVLVVQRQ